MKKLLLILCALLLCAGLSAAADEETVVDASGMFEYAVREDGSAELIEDKKYITHGITSLQYCLCPCARCL